MAFQSRQSIYTDEDLDRQLNLPKSKSRVYTNEDLRQSSPPDIMDDGSTDIMDDNTPPDILDDDNTTNNITPVSENEPDTFMEGVMNSGPEVLDAMGKGVLGFLKGATLDIPKTLMGLPHALETGFNLINPTRWWDNNPIDTLKSIGSGLKGMADTTMRAGGEPEAFGRMMGNVAGQPLVTAGLTEGIPAGTFGSTARIPSAINAAGYPTAAAGNIMKKYAPMSGMIPRLVEPRIARVMERGVGRSIENIGNRMKEFGVPPPVVNPLEGQLMDDMDLGYSEGQIIPNDRLELPPSETSFYNPEAMPSPSIIPDAPPIRQELPPSTTQYGPETLMPQDLIEGMPIRKELPPSNTHYQGVGDNPPVSLNESNLTKVAPEPQRIISNKDGTYTDTNTGKLYANDGKEIVSVSRHPVNDPNSVEKFDIPPDFDRPVELRIPDKLDNMDTKELWKLAVSKHINPRDYMTLDDGSLNIEGLVKAIRGNNPQVGNWSLNTTKNITPATNIASILEKPFTEMTVEELQTLSKLNLDKNVATTVKKELAKRVTKDSPIFTKNQRR